MTMNRLDYRAVVSIVVLTLILECCSDSSGTGIGSQSPTASVDHSEIADASGSPDSLGEVIESYAASISDRKLMSPDEKRNAWEHYLIVIHEELARNPESRFANQALEVLVSLSNGLKYYDKAASYSEQRASREPNAEIRRLWVAERLEAQVNSMLSVGLEEEVAHEVGRELVSICTEYRLSANALEVGALPLWSDKKWVYLVQTALQFSETLGLTEDELAGICTDLLNAAGAQGLLTVPRGARIAMLDRLFRFSGASSRDCGDLVRMASTFQDLNDQRFRFLATYVEALPSDDCRQLLVQVAEFPPTHGETSLGGFSYALKVAGRLLSCEESQASLATAAELCEALERTDASEVHSDTHYREFLYSSYLVKADAAKSLGHLDVELSSLQTALAPLAVGSSRYDHLVTRIDQVKRELSD